MTVRDLIHELLAYDMDDEVIVAQYDGGSNIDHVRADTVKKGQFVPDVSPSGNVHNWGTFTTEPINVKSAPAVIITTSAT